MILRARDADVRATVLADVEKVIELGNWGVDMLVIEPWINLAMEQTPPQQNFVHRIIDVEAGQHTYHLLYGSKGDRLICHIYFVARAQDDGTVIEGRLSSLKLSDVCQLRLEPEDDDRPVIYVESLGVEGFQVTGPQKEVFEIYEYMQFINWYE